MIEVGQVYRIPWRCDMLARVYAINNGWVALKWCDLTWDRTEDDLRYTIAEFLNEDPRPILMVGNRPSGCEDCLCWPCTNKLCGAD